MLTVQQIIELLKKDVVPALGCTEPVCVAFCAANAGKWLDAPIESIEVEVNAGIYKNGMPAGIPNCSEVGLERAAALGALLRNPEKKLELLEDVDAKLLEKMSNLIRTGRVCVRVAEQEKSLYVKCTVYGGEHTVSCIIRDAHTKITEIRKNGEIIWQPETGDIQMSDDHLVECLKEMKIEQLRMLAEEATEEELLGKLSPMCSCVMSSSTAASAAITYLLGGTDAQIGYAIRNMSGTVTGMLCDGGKVGCSLKVATGS